MPSAPRQIRPRLANARDSSRATQCAARVRRKNGTTVVVRCRTPKVSLGHSSRLSPRVNCAEAGATCGIAGPLRFFVFSEKLTESRRNKPSFWSRESQNDARRASTGRAVALTESAYRSVKQNQLDRRAKFGPRRFTFTTDWMVVDRRREDLRCLKSKPRTVVFHDARVHRIRPPLGLGSECTSRWRWRITSGGLARHRRARR